MNKEKQKGITLIALIITIIVILILVAVTVRTVVNSGLFEHAKEGTQQWADKQKEEAEINIDDLIKENVPSDGSYDGIYSVPGLEGKIAETDLFDYEIINDGTVASLETTTLPTKTARITRIKREYCNSTGYNPDTDTFDLPNTNYEIIYEGEKISDTLVIPYQVEIENELYKITEVNLDVGLGWSAGAPKVLSIIFPNTVEKIGYLGAPREHTPVIKNIILSQNLKEICSGMFERQANLESIIIPSSVISIGNSAFAGCSSLENIFVDEENSQYTDIDGVLFNKEKTKIIVYPASKNDTIYNIPSSVTSIGGSAFSNCTSLNSINIPSSVTTIGEYAFYFCTSLNSINIPNSVTSIGRWAFHYCTSLNSINIPSSVTTIGEYAFGSCTNLNIINCQATEKPSGWSANWNFNCSANVNWGVEM